MLHLKQMFCEMRINKQLELLLIDDVKPHTQIKAALIYLQSFMKGLNFCNINDIMISTVFWERKQEK